MLILTLIFMVLSHFAVRANMASPLLPGTYSSSMITSRNAAILSEKIHIRPNRDFTRVDFAIDYEVDPGDNGGRLPLVFIARGYRENFRLWLNDKDVTSIVEPVSALNLHMDSLEHWLGSGLATLFQRPAPELESSSFVLQPELSDLLFFEPDMPSGRNRIHIAYSANAWVDAGGWVKKYGIVFSLAPARLWKSQGSIDITLDATLCTGRTLFESNLGTPTSGDISNRATWQIKTIPVDELVITYTPTISNTASALIFIGPNAITAFVAVLISLAHTVSLAYIYRRRRATWANTTIVLGSLLAAVLIVFAFIAIPACIEAAIGPEAGGYHSYNRGFLGIVFFPAIFIAYMGLLWLIGKWIKKKLEKPTLM